jgi:hypothetical protein
MVLLAKFSPRMASLILHGEANQKPLKTRLAGLEGSYRKEGPLTPPSPPQSFVVLHKCSCDPFEFILKGSQDNSRR